jgi:hypothetical protein
VLSAAAQKSVDGAEALVAGKTKEKDEIIDKEFAKLKDLGLPESKLSKDSAPESKSKSSKESPTERK